MKKNGMETVAPGMEPTGHYWFNLGAFLQDKRNRATQKAMQNGKGDVLLRVPRIRYFRTRYAEMLMTIGFILGRGMLNNPLF